MEWGHYFKEDNLLIPFKSINKLILLMKIDKVIIINLEHRKDRRQQIIKELKRVGIDNFEFFKAVKPTEEMVKMWNPQFLNPIPQWFALSGGDHTKYRIGALGCMLSHMEIIKKCIEDKYENVLILEDDTMFDIRDGIKFHQIWDTLANQINNLDFGLLYLAGNHRGATLEKKTDNVTKIQGTLTTGSYIINKRAMKCIVDKMANYPREVDVFYSTYIQKEYPCYCIMPHLTRQGDGYSDIVQKNVSYKL
jgi:GR25 family glycosyltransferase involved in LPS biosynthesis